MKCDLHQGDCLEFLKTIEDNSIDSMVTDPPAGIAFMNLDFDSDKGGRNQWIAWLQEIMSDCLRVLKPGAHAFVWALPRTSHLTATALENAGFEIRDCVSHVFGSGFPKSADISKAIDKAAGAERKVVGKSKRHNSRQFGSGAGDADYGSYVGGVPDITAPTTPQAKQWDGWGTALKPSHEVWWLCRKPLTGTVASNVLEWGTGGINIDGCRVDYLDEADKSSATPQGKCTSHDKTGAKPNIGQSANRDEFSRPKQKGRWPSNLLLSHSEGCELVGYQNEKGYTINRWKDGAKPFGGGAGHPYEGEEIPGGLREVWKCSEDCPIREMDRQSGDNQSAVRKGGAGGSGLYEGGFGDGAIGGFTDQGGASRFFSCFKYQAKPSRAERDEGCEDLPLMTPGECTDREEGSAGISPRAGAGRSGGARNFHPTVKSIELMRWLIRLITPPGGTVLDLFMGSGTTGCAAHLESCGFIGIEKDPDYFKIAQARNKAARKQLKLF